MRDEDRPSPQDEGDGNSLWNLFDEVLAPLFDAGWSGDDEDGLDTYAEYDPEVGAILSATLRRTGMALEVSFYPDRPTVELDPSAAEAVGVMEDPFEGLSVIDSSVEIRLASADVEAWQQSVADACVELGVLDPTVIAATDDSAATSGEILSVLFARYVMLPAMRWREDTPEEIDRLFQTDHDLRLIIDWLGFAAPNVLPDPVPSAAVRGIAVWCWRNTEVEDWHSRLPSLTDVVMAKANIATCRLLLPHVTVDGVDWNAAKTVLTDPARTLTDGRSLGALFGEGWHPVLASVAEHLRTWRRLDTEIGPEATLRLLSAVGASSYANDWWSTDQWPRLCRAVGAEFTGSEVKLPPPFDTRGTEDLVQHLITAPDLLDDEVLDFCIDPPAAPGGRTLRGLRFNNAARSSATPVTTWGRLTGNADDQ